MKGVQAAALAAVITLVMLIVAAFIWSRFVGWQSFTNKTGDQVSWQAAGSADVSRLRFLDCTFTVVRSDGVVGSKDVTAVLNGMAVAYQDGSNNPTVLSLDRPLNPFSFVITGFNDSATVADPTKPPWCSAPPPACTYDSQCPQPVPGACGPPPQASGTCKCPRGQRCGSNGCPAGLTCAGGVCTPQYCFSCPGGATVTLTGKWRTI
ncbi:MAG: hypothetical protein WC700_10205 [Gemmatimonadaceae bacterium]|jgi:hypothetical protein